MKEHPILFSSEMVRAILDGRKTQTRRIIKPQPVGYRTCWSDDLEVGDVYIETDESLWRACESKGRNKRAAGELTPVEIHCPYGQVGDRLWVRETWDFRPITADRIAIIGYKADGATKAIDVPQGYNPTIHQKWRSPYHIPQWAARIFLEITNIRVERVQDISGPDVYAEGCPPECASYRMWFSNLWNTLNAKRGYGWDKNPWVWVIEFKKV